MRKIFNNLTINIDSINYGEKCNIITFNEEQFNEYQCNALSKQYEKLGFLNCRYKFKDDSVDIYYYTTNLISISQYFNQTNMRKTEFISIIKTICQSVKLCSNYVYFHANNFVLDRDLVYIDPKDNSIHILYVPSNEFVTKDVMYDLRNMIRDLINNSIIIQNGESNFTQEILEWLRDSNLNIDEFLQFLDNSVNTKEIKNPIESIPSRVEPVSIPVVERSIDLQQSNSIPIVEEVKSERKGIKGIFKSFFSSNSTETNNNSTDFNRRNIVSQNAYDDSDDTVILGCENKKIGYLIGNHQGNTEQIQINKDEFIIGRLKEAVDYDIANKTVGKIHAKFMRRDGKFYLIDLESKNGTYIDGTRLSANSSYEVENGATIIFSNVKYTFKIVG